MILFILDFPSFAHGFPDYIVQSLFQESQKDYPVLVKQESSSSPLSDSEKERRALSDVDSRGQGGITQERGFHTGVTNSDTLSTDAIVNKPTVQQKFLANQSGQLQEKYFISYNVLRPLPRRIYRKIPANYYFRNDFLLRFSPHGELYLPRRKIAGFDYFRHMMQRLRDTFTPPGLNFAYRDRAGVVFANSIAPQVVKVQFLLARNGDVLDVHLVESQKDKMIDEACLNTLRSKNFGLPPQGIFEYGNIFGISFIFPDQSR